VSEGLGSLDWLRAQARRAIQRGGNTLASFELFHLNKRVSDETRSVLIEVSRWLSCEATELPPREGPLVCGIDLGGSASMSAWANFWPQTGRLEAYGAFASKPSLLDRGRADGVSGRYQDMQQRGELITMGASVVPVSEFVAAMLAKLDRYPISTIVCDRFRQAEFVDALTKANVRAAPTFRGMGFKDGSEDCEAFRAAVFDGKVKAQPSLLLRSAFADAITISDVAGNAKIAKGRSHGRIDPACAAVLAIAEGIRRHSRPVRAARAPAWA
jgi:phage terminase large subunit-like protein